MCTVRNNTRLLFCRTLICCTITAAVALEEPTISNVLIHCSPVNTVVLKPLGTERLSRRRSTACCSALRSLTRTMRAAHPH